MEATRWRFGVKYRCADFESCTANRGNIGSAAAHSQTGLFSLVVLTVANFMTVLKQTVFE